MAEREIRYCTTEDGVRIAYCVEGEGPPIIVIHSFLESFSLDHLFAEYMNTVRRATPDYQRVYFDMRGTGLSERDVADMSISAVQRDLDAVVRALEFGTISLWGTVIGGLRVMDYAARHPERVEHLVLYSAFSRVQDVFSSEIQHGLISLARANWPLTARTLADLGARRESDEIGLRLAEAIRRSTTGETVARLIECNFGLDLTGLLPKIKAKTLILHSLYDQLYPIVLGQQIAAAIPRALFVPLQTTSNSFSLVSDDVEETIRLFLGVQPANTEPSPPELQSVLRTVLFTDLVGHTEMMSRLGDERGRDVLREHERITREVLKANGGTEVKTMGDGFMASFGSVTKAVECAIALQRAFAERGAVGAPLGDGGGAGGAAPNNAAAQKAIDEQNRGVGQGAASSAPTEPLSVRVGLNAGEPIEEDGDLFGATVILAARIAAKADGGEILVADTVRGLCSGKGFLFSDRGEFVAKGFDEAVRVYEVQWRH